MMGVVAGDEYMWPALSARWAVRFGSGDGAVLAHGMRVTADLTGTGVSATGQTRFPGHMTHGHWPRLAVDDRTPAPMMAQAGQSEANFGPRSERTKPGRAKGA